MAVHPGPVPHATFAGLTTEEPKALEDGKCQHLEGRLQVHLLLYAATTRVNQHFAVLVFSPALTLAWSNKPTADTASTVIMADYSTGITRSETSTPPPGDKPPDPETKRA